MAKRRSEGSEGRSRCGKRFTDHDFPPGRLSADDYEAFRSNYLPEGFESRPPRVGESINTFYPGELAFPISHFEAGLRLPFWPEVKQVLKYFGVVPAQLNPNAISIIIAFACYMRRERIEFSLTVFRKMFVYHANQDGVSFFTGLNLKVCETPNKNHHWLTRFVFIRGNLGGVPLAPVSPAETFYTSPQVGGTDRLLCEYLAGKNFEVRYLRRGLTSLPPVLPGEGERIVPTHPPYRSAIKPSPDVALATMAAEAARESLAPPPQKRVAEDSAPLRLSPSKKMRMKTKKTVSFPSGKGKAPADLAGTPGSLSPISVGSRSPHSPPLTSPRKAISLPEGEAPFAPLASSSCPSPRFPSRKGTSQIPLPSDHLNFDMGPAVPDGNNDPSLIWDKGSYRVSISTLLPSWREQAEPSAHAFSLGFGLYGGLTPDPLDAATTRDLVLRTAHSQLRTLELSHRLSRRLIFNTKSWKEIHAELETEREKSGDLAKRLEVSESLLAKASGGVDAETADRLRSRVEGLEAEVRELKAENARLKEAPLPRSQASPLPLARYTHDDVEEFCKDANIRTAELILKMMRELGVVKDGCEDITARDLVPEIYGEDEDPSATPRINSFPTSDDDATADCYIFLSLFHWTCVGLNGHPAGISETLTTDTGVDAATLLRASLP
ncbi:hypothetical protein KSP39_PZI021805 [Platanthera zijinensis]|uniref:Transposase (putative) gypsy type domain-containing protein n=1 Tax=Platanthera zijinensis TaxID=2320716 RepID=A0AAP0AXG2_9ASPA